MTPDNFLRIRINKAVSNLTEMVKVTEPDDVLKMQARLSKDFSLFRQWLKDENAFKLKERVLELELKKKIKIFEEQNNG